LGRGSVEHGSVVVGEGIELGLVRDPGGSVLGRGLGGELPRDVPVQAVVEGFQRVRQSQHAVHHPQGRLRLRFSRVHHEGLPSGQRRGPADHDVVEHVDLVVQADARGTELVEELKRKGHGRYTVR